MMPRTPPTKCSYTSMSSSPAYAAREPGREPYAGDDDWRDDGAEAPRGIAAVPREQTDECAEALPSFCERIEPSLCERKERPLLTLRPALRTLCRSSRDAVASLAADDSPRASLRASMAACRSGREAGVSGARAEEVAKRM